MRIRTTAMAATSAALALAVIAAAPAVAGTAFTLGGTGSGIPGLSSDKPWGLPVLAGYGEVNIHYPALPVAMDYSISQGVDTLHGQIMSTPGEKMAVGISQGALVIAYEKQRLMALSPEDRPAGDELTFVAFGDPSNPGGLMRWMPKGVPLPILGVTPVEAPETPYDTVYVTREYDGFADLPDRPLHLVATVNAVMGIVYVHARPDYASVDLSTVPERNVTETTNSLGGKTTSYLVPTAKLPLVQPLRDLGVPEHVVAAIEQQLKLIVDAGYARNDAPAPTAVTRNDAPAAVADATPARTSDTDDADDAPRPESRESMKAEPTAKASDDTKADAHVTSAVAPTVRESFKAEPTTKAGDDDAANDGAKADDGDADTAAADTDGGSEGGADNAAA